MGVTTLALRLNGLKNNLLELFKKWQTLMHHLAFQPSFMVQAVSTISNNVFTTFHRQIPLRITSVTQ
jgi:hypothetical protein